MQMMKILLFFATTALLILFLLSAGCGSTPQIVPEVDTTPVPAPAPPTFEDCRAQYDRCVKLRPPSDDPANGGWGLCEVLWRNCADHAQ
jgi:hypothetical protein